MSIMTKRDLTVGDSQWIVGFNLALEPRKAAAVEIAPPSIHVLPYLNGLGEIVLVPGEIVDILPCQPPPTFIVAV
jgi:hypothetical protein